LYYCVRFTPPGVKYLILDDFHFRIDPQIINYNGLSFHTSMGLPKLGRAAAPVRGHDPAARAGASRPRPTPPPPNRIGSTVATPTTEQPQSYDLSKSKSKIDGHMLVCNSRLFIETNFPVSLSGSESRSAQAKDQRSSGLLQLESHFRKLERRAAKGGALGRLWLLP
jgi:hypothetical protein